MSVLKSEVSSRLRILLSASALLLFTLLILDQLYPLQLPDQRRDFSQVVTARDGRILRAFADEQGIWRQQTDYLRVSPLYLQALLNYEDRWFWQHPGINPVSLFRAFRQNMQCGCVVSGGSTLTMQVARRFHPHERSVTGKLQQSLRALQLEWHLDKGQILNLYLNYAPFGGTVEGVEAASQAYLHKSAADLTHAEAALLAVLPQAPSRMRPDRYPLRAARARDKVLQRLVDQNVWSAPDVERAMMEQVFADKPSRPMLAPLLSRQLSERHRQQRVINTSIDYDLQMALEDQLRYWITEQPRHSSAAMLVVDNLTQQVLAYVGSADFSDEQRFGHVDMVRAIRSPGSTLKPFIYAQAMDKGLIHSQSLLTDAPRQFSAYKPQNFDRSFSGPVSVTHALHRSLNIPAVQVLSTLGSSSFYHQLTSAGIHLQLPKDAKPNLSLALGGAGISLWDLVKLYASLAREGQVSDLLLSADAGNTASRYLLSKQAAWVVHRMLQEKDRPTAVRSESVVREENMIGWKTGTSYGYRDAWAVGVTARYTVGVWSGRPDGTPTPGHYGALSAAPLMFQTADLLHRNQRPYLPRPDGVSRQAICWPLGRLASETAAGHCHKKMDAWIVRQQIPPTLVDAAEQQWGTNPLTILVDPDTGRLLDMQCSTGNSETKTLALWPKLLEPWVPPKYTRSGQLPETDASCRQPAWLSLGALKITGVSQGAVFRAAGTDASLLPVIQLQAVGGRGRLEWFVNGTHVFSAGAKQSLPYQFRTFGRQQVVVVDRQGDSDMLEVFVEGG